jgi:hypothetical protein
MADRTDRSRAFGDREFAAERFDLTNQLALGDIFNIDLAAVEHDIDEADASEDDKREAKSRLHQLASTAADIGKGTAGELLAAKLREYGL